MATNRMRWSVALGSSLLTAACGGLGPPQQGKVTGTVTVSGGPASPSGGVAFTGRPQQRGTVVLLSDGQQVAETTTDSLGHYSVTVGSGTYSVDACGAMAPGSMDSVTVIAGATTQHDIVCSVP